MGLDGDTDYITAEVRRCAILAWQLPQDSRVWRAVNPAGSYDMATLILRQIENDVQTFHWAFSEDAKNKDTAPEPMVLPGEEEAHQRAAEEADNTAAEVARIFGLNI